MSTQMEEGGGSVNYECDICNAIYENPVAAVRHIMNSGTGKHGESGSIPKGVMPSQTNEEPNTQTAEDGMEKHLREQFRQSELLADIEQNFEADVPPILSEHDMETLSLLQMDSELLSDLRLANSQLVLVHSKLESILENITTGPPDIPQLEEGTETETTEEEEKTSGRFSTAEKMEAERSEVMKVLELGGFLDSIADEAYDVFEEVYKQRDETENVEVSEVASLVGIPEENAEDALDALTEKGLIERDRSDDTYYYRY